MIGNVEQWGIIFFSFFCRSLIRLFLIQELQERDWLDEEKDIKVSQSVAEKGGSIPLSTWDTTGDLTQIWQVCQKVTSLHP